MPSIPKSHLLNLPEEIRELILSLLDQGTILSLSMTCTTLRHQVKNNPATSKIFPIQIALGHSHSIILSWHQGHAMLRSSGGIDITLHELLDNKVRHRFTEINLPIELNTISKVKARFEQSILLGQDKEKKPLLYVWGLNGYGQLGLGDYKERNCFTRVNLPTEIVFIHKIILGDHHTVLYGHDADNNSLLYACGDNYDGQLGLGDNNNRNCFTKVAIPDELAVLRNIVAGRTHTMLYGHNYKNKPVIYACGANRDGQLGLGDNLNKNRFTALNVPKEISSIISLKAGLHTLLLGVNTKGKPALYTCGYNSAGQLGHGNNQDKNIFTKVDIPEEIHFPNKIVTTKWSSYIYGLDSENKPILYFCGAPPCYRKAPRKSLNTLAPIILPMPLKKLNNVIPAPNNLFVIGRDTENKPQIYALGSNVSGEFGLGHNKERTSFTLIRNNLSLLKQKSIEMLEAFYQEEDEKEELPYIGFFNHYLSGCSKTKTLNATKAVIDFLKYNIPVDKIHEPALNNGRLAQIIKENQIELTISAAPVLTI